MDFQCNCYEGYVGVNCEKFNDLCADIKCGNNAFCSSTYLSWSCRCLDDSLYYGEYCEYESTELKIKQVLSKSFASIAIVAIFSVFLFVITMDVLKFVFGIDPVDREQQALATQRRKRRYKRPKRQVKTKKVALRFFYIP